MILLIVSRGVFIERNTHQVYVLFTVVYHDVQLILKFINISYIINLFAHIYIKMNMSAGQRARLF